ncbi:unnamed protein product [Citrullus colocynthis]|uniref:Uncharacterized protein n=1 Tax=Citrullus colocynthis TaxID=252529 RepID=A0ABP0Y5A4_9ROSI
MGSKKGYIFYEGHRNELECSKVMKIKNGMSVVTLHLHSPLSCSRNLYNIIDLVVVFPFSTACFFHLRSESLSS